MNPVINVRSSCLCFCLASQDQALDEQAGRCREERDAACKLQQGLRAACWMRLLDASCGCGASRIMPQTPPHLARLKSAE